MSTAKPKLYELQRVVTFGVGEMLALEEAEAAARPEFLEAAGSGLYRVTRPVDFLRGHVVGLLDLPKRLVDGAVAVQGRKGVPKPPPPDTTI